MDMIGEGKCWTGCGRDGYKAHRLDDRGGHIVLCELHSLEQTISRRDPDALELLAAAFELVGATYDAHRFRKLAVNG